MALILSVAVQAEAKKVKLQYQLKAGDQFKYEMSATQDIAQEVMGQSQTTKVNTSSTYDFKVIGVTAAGEFSMSAAMVAYSMSSVTPMGEMKYNSETDTVVPDFAKSSAAALNQYYTFTLSPMGKITGMTAPDGLVDKVTKIAEEQAGGQMQMGGGAAAGVTAEGFQKTMESMIFTFPDGGADLKKPWEQQSTINQMLALKVAAKFELVKASEEANEIKLTAQISQDPSAPPMEMQGMNLTYELLGAKEGTMILDPATGLIKTLDAATTISGTITIDSPQLPSPMSIPMTVNSKEKITKK
ncbi:MAG: DUF6263 family protein [Bacteroidales bacterium]